MGVKPTEKKRRRKRVRIIALPAGVFKELMPRIGEEYMADFPPPETAKTPFCIIEVKGKKIVLRKGEYEVVTRRPQPKKGTC